MEGDEGGCTLLVTLCCSWNSKTSAGDVMLTTPLSLDLMRYSLAVDCDSLAAVAV
jgi:hypothetical protein